MRLGHMTELHPDAYSGGNLFSADFGSLVTANSTAIEWNIIGEPNFPTTNYRPLMGLAQNHIHFLNYFPPFSDVYRWFATLDERY